MSITYQIVSNCTVRLQHLNNVTSKALFWLEVSASSSQIIFTSTLILTGTNNQSNKTSDKAPVTGSWQQNNSECSRNVKLVSSHWLYQLFCLYQPCYNIIKSVFEARKTGILSWNMFLCLSNLKSNIKKHKVWTSLCFAETQIVNNLHLFSVITCL